VSIQQPGAVTDQPELTVLKPSVSAEARVQQGPQPPAGFERAPKSVGRSHAVHSPHPCQTGCCLAEGMVARGPGHLAQSGLRRCGMISSRCLERRRCAVAAARLDSQGGNRLLFAEAIASHHGKWSNWGLSRGLPAATRLPDATRPRSNRTSSSSSPMRAPSRERRAVGPKPALTCRRPISSAATCSCDPAGIEAQRS